MFTYLSRAEWYGTDPPVSNNGTTIRPYVGFFTNGVAVHYTGGPSRSRNYTQDPAELMRQEQKWAISADKSFEYNYKILPRTDGSAVICEYAGLYTAAHAGDGGKYMGNNTTRCAIQFAIGVDNHPSYVNYDISKPIRWEQLTPSMIEAFQWLRNRLLVQKNVTTIMLPDQQLPGRQTACPGIEIMGEWDELLKLPQPDPEKEEEEMFKPELIKIDYGTALYQRTGHLVTWVDPDLWVAMGAPMSGWRGLHESERKALTIIGGYPPEHVGWWGAAR